MIRIYLAEDQSILQSALSRLLDLEGDLRVVGSAADGQSAWQEIQKLTPDVAVLDIEMPKMTGLEVARLIQTSEMKTKVVILSTFAQQIYFEQAVEAQVSGYLLKDIPSDELTATIRSVMKGATNFSPELVVNMIRADRNPLSKRELTVLATAAEGKSTKEIAKTLFLSEGTVRNYLSAIFSKLGVRNRIEAIQFAQRNKWI